MSKRISKSKFRIHTPRIGDVVASGVPLVNQGEPGVEARPKQSPGTDARESLRGSVLFYKRPFDPVGDDEWEALSES